VEERREEKCHLAYISWLKGGFEVVRLDIGLARGHVSSGYHKSDVWPIVLPAAVWYASS
jgi:hypothetical protein